MSFRFSRRAVCRARRCVLAGLLATTFSGCGTAPGPALADESSEQFLARVRTDVKKPVVSENPAMDARFREPEVTFNTPAFQEGRTRFTTQPELQAILRNTAWASVKDNRKSETLVNLLALGKSQSGVPIEALLFTRRDGDKPLPALRDGRPTVMLMGQQHGDDPATAEALLVVTQILSEGGSLNGLLDLINVIVMPRTNPDGAALSRAATANGIDLDRDQLYQQTPEARAVARAMEEFHPVVVVDSHEYPEQPDYLRRFGAEQRFDALIQYATPVNGHEFIAKAAEEWFRAPMLDSLQLPGLTAEWSHAMSANPGDPVISGGGLRADVARNVFGLRNLVSLKIETRGAGAGRQGLKRRMQTQLVLMDSVLRSTAARAADLLKLRRYVENSVRGEACKGQVMLDARPTTGLHVLQLVDPTNGLDKAVEVQWASPLAHTAPVTRARPCGYWLAADQASAVSSLRALGVKVEKLGADAVLQGEAPMAPASAASAAAPVPASVVAAAPTPTSTPASAPAAADEPASAPAATASKAEDSSDTAPTPAAAASASAAVSAPAAASAPKVDPAPKAAKPVAAPAVAKKKPAAAVVESAKDDKSRKAPSAFTAPANSYYVPLNQPLANLVVAALDPDAPNSYLAHGLVTSRDREARVTSPPKGKRTALP